MGKARKLPKRECCASKCSCGRCPLRMLKEGTLPSGYTVKKRKLVRRGRQESHEEEAGARPPDPAPDPTPRIGQCLHLDSSSSSTSRSATSWPPTTSTSRSPYTRRARRCPGWRRSSTGQALEERDHAMMMVQYLLDTDADVVIPAVEATVSSFDDVVAPVQLALEQEKRVTEQINGAAADRPRGERLRLRAVHAVVHQGAGRGGRHDERPARGGRPATPTTSRTSRSTSRASRTAARRRPHRAPDRRRFKSALTAGRASPHVLPGHRRRGLSSGNALPAPGTVRAVTFAPEAVGQRLEQPRVERFSASLPANSRRTGTSIRRVSRLLAPLVWVE